MDYDMDTWKPWMPAISGRSRDLTLQNWVYFVFITEFVKRLPTIFPVILGTYLFEIEHRKMINFRSFAQRNGLDQWSNNPSSNRADQWSDKTLSRVDLINHWSENGFARKEHHRSEILIQIIPKERTISLKMLFLFLSFQWHWLSWRTRLWGSRRGDGFLRLTLHFLPLWLD